MNKINWLRDYREQTKCDLRSAMRAWDNMHAKMAEDTNLRDAAALAALPSVINLCWQDTREPNETWEQMFARKAFQIADAFITARETKETP